MCLDQADLKSSPRPLRQFKSYYMLANLLVYRGGSGLPRRGRSQGPGVCPNCGAQGLKPDKTWQVISPLPDARGRITITVMGSYRCPNCGRSWRATISKIKTGGSDIEIEGRGEGGGKKVELGEERRGTVIEIDLNELGREEE